MNLRFEKYHGTGNDFILLNGWQKSHQLQKHEVAFLCDRHFGIGADGLIILEPSSFADFKMVYYNSDGNLSSMCGNGGRCISQFAFKLGIASENMKFEAVDGIHLASITAPGYIELGMNEVRNWKQQDNVFVLNTGSPHYVYFAEHLNDMDIIDFGKKIRYSQPFIEEGINVNLCTSRNDGIELRTYERGVEDETLSCGTGVTAAAIAASLYLPQFRSNTELCVYTKGGELKLKFSRTNENTFNQIFLCGPAKFVFSGEVVL